MIGYSISEIGKLLRTDCSYAEFFGANVLRVRRRLKFPGHVPRELEQILDNLELADQIPPHLLIGNSHCHQHAPVARPDRAAAPSYGFVRSFSRTILRSAAPHLDRICTRLLCVAAMRIADCCPLRRSTTFDISPLPNSRDCACVGWTLSEPAQEEAKWTNGFVQASSLPESDTVLWRLEMNARLVVLQLSFQQISALHFIHAFSTPLPLARAKLAALHGYRSFSRE